MQPTLWHDEYDPAWASRPPKSGTIIRSPVPILSRINATIRTISPQDVRFRGR